MTGKSSEKKKKMEEAEKFYKKGLIFGQESDAEGAIECWLKTVIHY